ncbi:MAG: lipopolysaccharide biosynthesis protein [Candidatus Binatia bacterium]|jgi:O-antigen/teichoic acid export membrane protein
MSLTVRVLTKQTSVYGVFQLAQRGVSFVVIPLYTHYLTPEEFGSLDILYLIVWLVGIVGGSKLDAAFIRYYATARNSGKVTELVSSSFLGLVCVASTFCALSAIGAKPILELVYSARSLPLSGFYVALTATWLELVGALPLAYLRVKQEARLVGSIQLGTSLVGSGVGLACVIVLNLGIVGVLLGAVTSGVLLVAIGYWAMLTRVPVSFTTGGYALTLYKYALPMLPAPLFMYVLNYADRYFLVKYWSLDEVGVYGLGYKFAMLLSLVIMSPFAQMWGPNQFALHAVGQKETYRRLALLYVSALYLAALCITYVSYEVTLIALAKAYHGLLTVVAPLTVGVAIWGIVPTLDFGCLVRNKTWIRSVTTGIAALLNILLNLVLIPPFGPLGAALATLASFVVLTLVTYLYNRSLTDYHLDVRQGLFLSVLLLVLASIFYLESFIPYALFTVIRVGAVAAFVFVLMRINDVRIDDLVRYYRRRQLRWATKEPCPAAH